MNRGNRDTTLQRRIESLLADTRGLADDAMTATEIARKLGVGLSSVSSCLRKMVRKKRLVKVPGFGPRGGNGYRGRTITESIYDGMAERIAREIDRKIMDDMLSVCRLVSGSVV